MLKSPNLVNVRRGDISCSFITIPNGLRQHPLAAAIIHTAKVKDLIGKLPDPSSSLLIKNTKSLRLTFLTLGFLICFEFRPACCA